VNLWPVAVITFKEGLRNRAMFGIAIFSLLFLTASILISNMIPRSVGKVLVDMSLSAVSLSGLLLVLFVGINLLAKDLDKRTIYMVLARPISRPQYLTGKFLGVVMLLAATICIVGIFSAGSLALAKGMYPKYFDRFSWYLVFVAILFAFLSMMLLSAVSFLFASFVSNSFVTLVLTVVTYLVGHAVHDVKALVEAPKTVGIEVSTVTVKVVQFAYYLFPNLSLFDIKQQAAHGLAIPVSQVAWTLSYGLVYTTIVMLLAGVIFSYREFP